MHAVTMQRVGPGSYFKDQRLDTLGKHKPSNSVKGFGNGFISKVDRGLLDPVASGLVQINQHSRSQSQPRQGMGQQNRLAEAAASIKDGNQKGSGRESGT